MKKLFFILLLVFPGILLSQSIVSVNPNTAQQGQTLSVSVTGSGTSFGQGTTLIKLWKAGVSVFPNSTTIINSSQINATFSFNTSHPAGLYDVMVYGTNSVTMPAGFNLTVNPATGPSIVSASPNTGTQGQTLSIAISGHNTVFQQGTNIVKLFHAGTTIFPSGLSFVNDSLINATFNFTTSHPAGAYDVIVANYMMTQTLTLPAGFTLGSYVAPSASIQNVSPNSAFQGQTLAVSISASNTNFTQATTLIKLFNGSASIYPSSISILNDSLASANFSLTTAHTPGLYDVIIYGSGTLVMSNGFTLNPASPAATYIESVNPDYAVQGQTLTVGISGHNTVFQQGTNIVKLYGGGTTIYPTSSVFVNDSLINATFAFNASHPAGLYDVVIGNYSGSSSLSMLNGFTLYSPTVNASIVEISPASANQGDPINLLLTGLNTHFGSGNDTIWLSDIYGNSIYPVSMIMLNDTSMIGQFNFTLGDLPGTYSVYQSNLTDGIISFDNSFELYGVAGAPMIMTVSPSSGIVNQFVTISFTGNGTHFTSGADTISLVNSLFRSTTFVYPNTMSVINDTLIQAGFDLTGVDGGTYDILVQGTEDVRLAVGFMVAYPVSLNENILVGDLSVYPNPSTGVFNLKAGKTFTNSNVNVTDLQGKIIISEKMNGTNSSVDLSAFTSGMYFIQVTNEDKMINTKIIKE
ncbi:MAG: hypothetical protein K0Q95_2044 [Bacteroidota bacterium]|jgi:hypothetical protein|nr:hypothetical protein [Bacteroidota bacterium]